ncbi:MAG: AbrB/MazE/SpoVT family DNA-binding domain-containing protein [Kiloniellaceae bacterium]
MRKPLKIRRIGTSLGLVLPKELLAELSVGEGDLLYPVRTPDGLALTRYDPRFAQAVEASRRFMRKYPNAMKKLAQG